MLTTCELRASYANALRQRGCLPYRSAVTMIRLASLSIALAASYAAFACKGSEATASPKTIRQYDTFCSSCHEVGAANAPRRGDAHQWGKRLRKGEEQLLKSINNGLVAMPPKGGCSECNDADFRALIQYMSQP